MTGDREPHREIVPAFAPPSGPELVILILAPTGSDARHTAEFLRRASLPSLICRDMADLCHKAELGCGALLIAEEVIASTSVSMLLECLSRQPSWSDIPVVLITSGGESSQARLRRLKVFGPAGNVMLLERPFRPDTLVSALEVALRSRRRQYEVRDLIAERTRNSQELERLVRERTAALQETVAQLESFSYSITHDMRGPLRAMTSYAQILRKEFKTLPEAETQEYLGRIIESSHRLDRLIQDVLQYSRLSRDDMPTETVDVNKLLRTVIAEYPVLLDHRQHITIDCSVPPVRANSAALSQCFSNLLINAIKFMPPDREPEVHIECEQSNHHVRVTVQDNGIGISPAYHDRIWGAFNRLHDNAAYEGTGIGLAIVKRAVERMRGKVGVESAVGQGSRFWIELPTA
jgi:signal transduction histidine kinase